MSTWWPPRSAQRSAVDAAPALLSNHHVPKYDAFGREIGEDTLSGRGSEASKAAAPPEAEAVPMEAGSPLRAPEPVFAAASAQPQAQPPPQP